MLRIESPGENFEVEKALLAAGAAAAQAEGTPALSPRRARRLSFDRGLILYPRQWYLGFCHWLRLWRAELACVADVRLMNAPRDVEIMFDKTLCRQALSRVATPTPAWLGPVACYEELLARMSDTRHDRVFVKLANGSSASGVVAFRRCGARHEAITTAELVRGRDQIRLYNSLKIRRYTQPRDIADVIDALCRQRVHVEAWLPKAKLQGLELDLRVVVIAGRAAHFVVRQSRSPMTNLHLGNPRGDPQALLARMGEDNWRAVRKTCEAALTAFPDSLYAGVDVAIMPDFRDHAVLELNAFGDLLPRVEHRGLDTYAAEVAALLAPSR